MPVYDYECRKCGKHFALALSIADRDAGKARCPACRSSRLAQQVSAVSVKTSKKS